jgi:alkaline phosphatase D
MPSLTRRLLLKLITVASASLGLTKTSRAQNRAGNSPRPTFEDAWRNTHDRIWLGADVWANPMEDWRVLGGAAECQSSGGNRNIHLTTHQLTNPQGVISMSVNVTRVAVDREDGGAGFRLGIRSDINEYRSNCFARGGIDAGLVDGKLVLGRSSVAVQQPQQPNPITLQLQGTPAGNAYRLHLTASDSQGNLLAEATEKVQQDDIAGNVALVCNYKAQLNAGQGARYRFSRWSVGGDAFTVNEEHRFGPILWSMYSLSDSRGDDGYVMKITALTGPLGEQDNQEVELYVDKAGDWKSLGTALLDTDAWTATFRISQWDAAAETPYMLVYRNLNRDGSESESIHEGKIKANPTGRPLRLGALTCQKDYGFPYQPVAQNIVKLDPDLIYFSGDQLYENHGGYGLIRDPADAAILNYLRKFYMFGWAFRDTMRDRPTLCIPDDHDVFQGNIWGEGGAPMSGIDKGASSKGGYREPAKMVNVVHRTNTSHHPDIYDPKPCKQDISVYFGDMVYGGVSFAILGDRQFKSGPERVDTGSGRADHVLDKDFDTSVLDKPGLVLLGDRQEEFLKSWVKDWRGHQMKVLLSQTVWAGVATHHGGFNGYLKADLDSGGWPQTARDEAIRIVREGMPLHVNGDQHLTSLVQYGVDRQRDSCWSFCTPAISAGYPRWWRPDEVGMPHTDRPEHGLPDTGKYVDGLGNQVYVYAVGNPEVGSKKNRYELAHQKGSGFGLVTIDTEAKTYLIECFRFLIDPTDGNASNQFPGFPATIHQRENSGDNVIG